MLICSWRYTGSTLLTQTAGLGSQPPCDLDRGAAQFTISSPRSEPDMEIVPDMVVNGDEEGISPSLRRSTPTPAL
jgi:hypothetical protein